MTVERRARRQAIDTGAPAPVGPPRSSRVPSRRTCSGPSAHCRIVGGGGGSGDSETSTDRSEARNCLIGSWVFTNAEMNTYYDAVVAACDVPGFRLDIPIGQIGLTFTPDTFEYAADFTLVLDVAGTSGTGVANGTATGGWTTADAAILWTRRSRGAAASHEPMTPTPQRHGEPCSSPTTSPSRSRPAPLPHGPVPRRTVPHVGAHPGFVFEL